MDNESERGVEVTTALPRPAVTFADHSYPAYSAKQMIAYGAACFAAANLTTGWRTIDTAPKEGQAILVWAIEHCGEVNRPTEAREVLVAEWCGGQCGWPGDDWWSVNGSDGYAAWCRASFWQPLPAPPPTTPTGERG